MAYLPERFSLLIGRDPVGGPTFATEIAITRAGHEQRNETHSRSRHRFDFSHDIKSTELFLLVDAHFRMARGRLHKWRARDWADYKCDRSAGALVDLTATTFQLHKVYGTVVGFQEARRITRIFEERPVRVWKNGSLQTLTTHYTVDVETGIVTFVTPPGVAVLECEFWFDVPCRYDTDELQATLVQHTPGAESYYAWKSVPVIEVLE